MIVALARGLSNLPEITQPVVRGLNLSYSRLAPCPQVADQVPLGVKSCPWLFGAGTVL